MKRERLVLSIENKAKPQVRKQPDSNFIKLVESLNKKFGENAITLGFPKTAEGKIKMIQRVPTGSFSLDIALGGGLPLGRFTEISGALSSTKTTQCLHIIRNAQKMGLTCAFVDVEATTDETFMRSIGIDVENVLYSRPDGMEEACQLILDLQKSGTVHLAVLDSIAAMSPNKEQESAMDETFRMGVPQQMLGEFFRKYQANNNRLEREGKQSFTLIGINQLREAIGKYGDPEYTPGGRAKGFTASVDIRFRRGDWIAEGTNDNKEFVGQIVKFKIEKNKTYRRMQTGEFDFYFAENKGGITPFFNDVEKEIVISAIEWNVVERQGSWFSFTDQKYQGISNLISAMKENPEMVEIMKNQILQLTSRSID